MRLIHVHWMGHCRAPAQAPRRLHFERVATCQSRDHAHARLIDIPKLVPATFPDNIQMFTCGSDIRLDSSQNFLFDLNKFIPLFQIVIPGLIMVC